MKLQNLENFDTHAATFLKNVLTFIEHKLNYKKSWQIDHLCYRVETLDRYYLLKEEFKSIGELLIESLVGGRMISTFRLHRPIVVKEYSVSLLELPAPKVGKLVSEGFEHIEMVIDIPFVELKAMNPHMTFLEKGAMKPLNPEIEAKFADFSVKFHHMPLDKVIELEKRELSL